jgi:hypothetical protein
MIPFVVLGPDGLPPMIPFVTTEANARNRLRRIDMKRTFPARAAPVLSYRSMQAFDAGLLLATPLDHLGVPIGETRRCR